MRAKILLLFVFYTTVSAFGQDVLNCPWKKCLATKKYQFIKVAKTIHRREVIDMGGGDARPNFYFRKDGTPNIIKHWQPWETHRVKTRQVYITRVCSIKMKAWSNDDTGNDHLRVFTNDTVLVDSEFGDFKEFKLSIDFFEPQIINFEVSNKYMANNSPGAFQLSIYIEYEVQVWRWKRFRLNSKKNVLRAISGRYFISQYVSCSCPISVE